LTHGLLEADLAGVTGSAEILRRHFDWFDYAIDELAQFLPALGGPNVTGDPWPGGVPPDPYGEPFCRRDLQTNQGMVHNTRMALSRVGTQRDVDVVIDLYLEQWWVDALAAQDPSAIWMRHFYPHNYEITALEAILDIAVITGESRYLDAVMGAWKMFRSFWIHVGGSIAINEAQLYPPKSYFLSPPNPDWEHPTPHPTGELCGSSFWIKLNQRLLQLFPDEEVYAAEIERSILNVVLASVSEDGSGIRYFARLHQHKDDASNVSTCCEGQGTRELGALPEYLFSTSADGVHLHLFQAATLNAKWGGAALSVDVATLWPAGDDVLVTVSAAGGESAPAPAGLGIVVRIPSWVAGSGLVVLNVTDAGGVSTTVVGSRGSYVRVEVSTLPSTISFSLPAQFMATVYEGFDQIGNSTRVAIERGPVLLAATVPGALTPIGNTSCVILPALDVSRPEAWLVPVPGSPLHYSVDGAPGVVFIPYYEVQEQNFTVYPIYGGGY
jgi:Beta-L-arabinofuranosidase, GH127